MEVINGQPTNSTERLSSWFPDGRADKGVNSATSVLDQNRFWSRLPKLPQAVVGDLIRIRHGGKKPKTEKPLGQEELLRQLESMSLEDLSTMVHAETQSLQETDAQLALKRTKGVHKVAFRFQEFAVTFDRFLSAYSGVVDIMQTADAQFGGVACATLSLLFATVRLKAGDEESIHSAMQKVTDGLPDCKIYERIYPNPSLGTLLAEVYRGVIVFAQEATVYFQGHGFARTLRSMGRPLRFQVVADEMQDNFSRVRHKCDALLAEQVDRLLEQNKDLQKRFKQMQEREESRLVIEMKRHLDLGDYDKESLRDGLSRYRDVLAEIFNKDRHRSKLDLSTLAQHEHYMDWEKNGSSLLVLFGRNESGMQTIEDSWLSPVALELIESLLESNKWVAYCLCTQSSSHNGLLSALLYQLLETNPAVLRKGDDLQDIDRLLSQRGSKEDRVRALRQAVLRVIDLFDDTVYLVIDRPELCSNENPVDLINVLLHLVEESKTKLKVMAVLRSEWWDPRSREKEVDTRGLDPRKFQRLELDQYRL